MSRSEKASQQPRVNGKFAKKEDVGNQSNVKSLFGSERYAPKPKGTLKIKMFGKDIEILAGPYAARPEGYFGVKMAKEIDLPCDLSIPTPDFRTPTVSQALTGSIEALTVALSGGKVYVGCMAGQGRTGLFLGVLAHVSGVDDYVGYVRRTYYPHAMETKEQEEFPAKINREAVRRMVMRELVAAGEINFTFLRAMSWRDRWLWLKVKIGG